MNSLVQRCLHRDDSSTDSDEKYEEFMRLYCQAAQITTSYVDVYVDKNPARTSTLSGMGWLNKMLNTPDECHSQLCIESNRRRQNRFKHSGETIGRKFDEVVDAVMPTGKDFIGPKNPNFPEVHRRIRDDRRAYPHFKDCIGTLDGTHIRVCLSPDDQVRYIGKSGIPTQNALAICDFDMRFTYVSTGQPGSMHDTSVLYSAIKVDEKFFPHRREYPNHPGYLAPYKGERYHMLEFRHRGMDPKTPKEKFNRVHSSIRNVIERSFGVLKMNWQILYNMPPYSMKKQKKIIAATMVLHNFIREHRTEDLDFARFDRDPDYVPTILERYNRFATGSDGSTTMLNAPTMNAFRDALNDIFSPIIHLSPYQCISVVRPKLYHRSLDESQ
ncbi:hypothetical protein U9M48_031840, partial [Paspalum notatum var. saurae]